MPMLDNMQELSEEIAMHVSNGDIVVGKVSNICRELGSRQRHHCEILCLVKVEQKAWLWKLS